MDKTQDNPTSSSEAYQRLCDHTREVALLVSTQSVLEWDQQTRLPPAGGEYRASQIATMAGLVHQRQTSSEVGQWLAELKDSCLAADPHGDQGAVIRQLARQYDKKIRLPQALVEELTRTAVLGQQVWAEARKANDFATFQPLLEKTLDLKRQEAAALGYETTPYDPLLDDYEPGETTANVSRVLADLRDVLVPIVQSIAESANRPDATLLAREFPSQWGLAGCPLECGPVRLFSDLCLGQFVRGPVLPPGLARPG